MNLKLPVSILIITIALSAYLLSYISAEAATVTTTPADVGVQAHVGEYSLNLSGSASPFASIVMTSNGTFYRSTTADANGFWSLTNILVSKSFTSFCLQHIDFKNIGDSEACFTIPPVVGNVTKKDIFLPPTIGLQRSQIQAGGSAVIFGYTMPFSKVTIHLSNGESYDVTSDAAGYYELTIKNMKAGTYQLFATAVYNGQNSEAPSKTVTLTALSWWQMLLNFINDIIKWLRDTFSNLGLGPLLLLFPLIPLIIYLILKIWPDAFTSIYDSRIFIFFNPKSKKLHHAWFMGY